MSSYPSIDIDETLEDFDLRIAKLEFIIDEILEELKKKDINIG